MVGECLRQSGDDAVSAPSLRDALIEQFALRLPLRAVEALIRRCQKRGYVYSANRVYYRNLDVLRANDTFREAREKALAAHDALIGELRGYCRSRFSLTWTTEDAERALQSYVQNNEVSLLTGADTPIIAASGVAPANARYVVASFVNMLRSMHPAIFHHLETVVQGSMLANAIYLPDPARPRARFERTQVFFDTSFLIYALGYAGIPRQEPCTELLDLLYETGAELSVFRHTVDEIHGILEACRHNLRSRDAYGPSMEYFISIGASESDLLLYAETVERNLSRLRIQVADTPGYDDHAQVIDEKGFAAFLDERIGYKNPDALNRDVQSVAAIVRLRKGEPYFHVENCRALFVTTNQDLARAARDFVQGNIGDSVVSPCITDFALTNVLWLKGPTTAPQLPRKRVIADAYAAMQPSEQMIRKYIAAISELASRDGLPEEDYYLLRYSMEARKLLMDSTLGDDDAVTQATVAEILSLAKAQIRGEAQARLDSLEAELNRARAAEAEREAAIRARARAAGRAAGGLITYALLALLLFGTLAAFPWGTPGLARGWWRYGLSVGTLALLTTSLGNLILGTTVKSLQRSVELGVTSALHRGLLRLVSSDSGEMNRPS